MNEEERQDELTCADCGAAVIVPRDPVFVVDDETVLCLDCAIRRGGAYDGQDDRWTRAPNVADLRAEQRADDLYGP